MTIPIVVVDDHALMREGVVKLLNTAPDFEVVGEASNGFEAVEKAAAHAPCIVLMDLSLPGLSGIEATRRILRDVPGADVIVLTASSNDDDILEAVRAGAKGYIVKDATSAMIFTQIRQVAQGGVALSEQMAAKLIAGLYERPRHLTGEERGPYAPLTDREMGVLELISQGMANKEIAGVLYISENTARAHVRSLMQKLGLDNRTQLAVYGVREGVGWHSSNGQEDGRRAHNAAEPAAAGRGSWQRSGA